MMNRFSLLVIAMFLIGPALIAGQEFRYDHDELLNCEQNLVRQDIVVNDALEKTKTDGVLIAIVRLGDGENSQQLVRRRIFNIRQYFRTRGHRLPSEKLVVAQGEKVKGYGRIEYYLDGKLHERLLYPKNSFICQSCCGPDPDYYPYKPKRKVNNRQRKK